MTDMGTLAAAFADFVWGTPLLVLMVGGGLFFAFYSRFLPYRHMGHAIGIMLGRYDTPAAEGELTHAQALAAALSGTLGLGNVAGVALAIVAGGPGAVFWMWVSAMVGIATKFFTCSLGIMYRGHDSLGQLQGGPQYIIREALPRQFYPLAVLFSAAGLIGTLPMFQTNQLTALIRDTASITGDPTLFNLITGCIIATIVASVIFGGLSRVAQVSVALLPTMTVTYLGMTTYVLVSHAAEVPAMFSLILTEAFNPQAFGGGLMGVMLVGISRGAFSNEAGLGTEVMAHGAARTSEPIREGLVATLGPVIDTLIVCTCTALVILLSGLWQQPGDLSGISMTMTAFRADMGMPRGSVTVRTGVDTQSYHHVYRLVLWRQVFWFSGRCAVPALVSLLFPGGDSVRRHGQHRRGIQSYRRCLWPHGDTHHDGYTATIWQGDAGGERIFLATTTAKNQAVSAGSALSAGGPSHETRSH